MHSLLLLLGIFLLLCSVLNSLYGRKWHARVILALGLLCLWLDPGRAKEDQPEQPEEPHVIDNKSQHMVEFTLEQK